MIIKCPTCAGALEYDAETGKMCCPYCNSLYDPSGFSEGEYKPIYENEDVKKESQNYNDESSYQENTAGSNDTMEMNIYKCKSCGAELSVNGVESSTFCAYCGQPTVIFDRVSNQLRPKYIIPFKIPKGKALQIISERLKSSYLIPKEIQNFEVERIRGIYIPYWLYDLYYYDDMLIKSQKSSGKTTVTVTSHREADVTFHRLTVDASKLLNDDSSQRLEPFDMADIVPFEIGYMTGFYGDKYDETQRNLRAIAISRASELFIKEVFTTVEGNNKRVSESNPKVRFEDSAYAMLPAWFMTFRYKDRPYTFMVNGQTGKIVGAVPYDKGKFFATLGAFFTVLVVPCGLITTAVLSKLRFSSNALKTYIFVFVILSLLVYYTIKNFNSFFDSISLSTESKINRFVKERQDRD